MKLLVYSANYAPELVGIGKYSGEMAAALVKQGHEVRVVAAPPYYPAWKIGKGYNSFSYSFERFGDVKVWRAPLWVPKSPGGAARVLHLMTFAVTSVPLMFRQLVWAPDVVLTVAPAFVCAPVGWLTARLSGAKAWLHVQDFEVDVAFRVGLLKEGWIGRMVRPIERFLFRRFDCVSSISVPMLNQALSKGVKPAKLRFFPNWVDLAEISPAPRDGDYRRQLGLDADHTVVLYSGSLGRKHGLMMIPDMARRLRDRPGLVFVICGDGAMKQELDDACSILVNTRRLPLQPAHRLSELLAMADIHLLPQGEGVEDLVLPSKLSGMLASGRPVVATCRQGSEMARVVANCGLSVEPGDPEALAVAILHLADRVQLRHELGRLARAYAEEHLAYDKILGRLSMDLESLTRNESVGRRKPEKAADGPRPVSAPIEIRKDASLARRIGRPARAVLRWKRKAIPQPRGPERLALPVMPVDTTVASTISVGERDLQ